MSVRSKKQPGSVPGVYSKLYDDWFRKVFRVYAVGFVVVVACEIIAGLVMGYFNDSSTGLRYTLRRIVIPTGIDGLLILINLVAFKLWNISEWIKNSIAILVLTLIGVVLSSIHNFFEVRFSLFLVPLIASIAFASIRFMVITAVSSVAGVWVSLFLPLLWKDEMDLTSQALSAGFITLVIIVVAIIEKIILELFNERETLVQSLSKENIRLSDEAERDELTSLYNRKGFIKHAGQHIKEHTGAEHILLVCDINNFKGINETIGEQGADELLKHCAEYLRKISSETDNVYGRYGGDQFVIMLDKNPDFNVERLMEWNKDLIQSSQFKGYTVKYGIRKNVTADESIVTVCDQARAALKTIKNDYHRHVAEYDPSMSLQSKYQQILERDMKEALKEEQFKIYFQPKHEAATGKLAGAEALVRWEHPKLGLVPPDMFIPLFERNGFITKLDMYIWRRVCRDLRYWKGNGLQTVPVSVNISRRDLIEFDSLEVLNEAVTENRLDKKYLHIEITESLYMDEESEKIIKMIRDARYDGYAIELDDFGSGYSSLGMIGELPVDVLKLDMSFARNLETKQNVVKSVIYLANLIGVKTIAEGVETEEQLSILKKLKCDYIQGFYFSEPLSEEHFFEYLKTHT